MSASGPPAEPGRLRRRRLALSKPQVGLIGAVLVALLAFGCYTKFANPFASHFTVEATFQNANGLLPGSPVRIAGVDVGEVTGVKSLAGAGANGSAQQGAEVTMRVEKSGLPLHADSTFDIRPRIFLEGNFFVDVYPGTPESPAVSTGHVFPMSAGTEPVQLDQLLTSLQSSTRRSLQVLIQQYGVAVKRGGPAYNASIPYSLPAYKYSSEVTHDLLGQAPNDVETLLANGATVSGAVDRYPQDLKNLLANLDTTAAAFASQRANLAEAVHELPQTLSTATPTFAALDAAYAPLDRFARAAIPGVRSAGPASVQTLPLVGQLRELVQPDELQGLSRSLAATVPSLAKLTRESLPLLAKEVRPAASCVVNNIYPWSQLSIDDGTTSTKPGNPVRKVFQEAVDYLPGLAGETRNFDPNGSYIRVLLTGGSLTYSLSPGMFGSALEPLTSVQPQLPAGGTRPPLHPGTACETQPAITQAGLQAAPGGAISAVQTNLDAPGATLRWADAVTAAIGEIRQTAGQEGTPVALSSGLTSELKALLQKGLTGRLDASELIRRALESVGAGS